MITLEEIAGCVFGPGYRARQARRPVYDEDIDVPPPTAAEDAAIAMLKNDRKTAAARVSLYSVDRGMELMREGHDTATTLAMALGVSTRRACEIAARCASLGLIRVETWRVPGENNKRARFVVVDKPPRGAA